MKKKYYFCILLPNIIKIMAKAYRYPFYMEQENQQFPNGILIVINSSKSPYNLLINNEQVATVLGNSVYKYDFKESDHIMKVVQESGFAFKPTILIEEIVKSENTSSFWEIP